MNLRLCYIINDLNQGGAERLLVDALPFYREAGIHVELLQISSKCSYPGFLSILDEQKIIHHELSKGSIYNPFIIFKIRKFLEEANFDIIHVHLFPAMYWVSIASKLMKSKPILVFTEHSTQNNRLNKWYFKFIDRYIYKSYQKIIAISSNIKMKLDDWTLMSSKIEVVRNGVDTKSFNLANPYPVSFFYESFSIPPNSKILLMVARFLYPKDHITLIKALKILPQNFIMLFAGTGKDQVLIENFVEEQGLSNRVRFLGFRNDIPMLMKSADINILSSSYEGMSGVTLQALATGKPFLGSDVPGINDTVPGPLFLFKKGDEIDLARKIQDIINDQNTMRSTVEIGTTYVSKFSMEIMIAKHKSIYEALYYNLQ